jgi:hypothetical protein
VASIRKMYPLWGARRIANQLRAQGKIKVPAPSTISAILSRQGILHRDQKLGALELISAAPSNEADFADKAGLPPIGEEPELAIVLEHLISRRVLGHTACDHRSDLPSLGR